VSGIDFEVPLIGILRGFDADAVERLVGAASRGGLRNLEVTMDSRGAPDLIRVARKAGPPGMRIGAGTVRGLEDLRSALEAGAEFIVTPVVVEDVIRRCRSDGVFVIPGAFTPTEIHRAWDLGADLVKLFPADQLGPAYVRSVKGPLPEVKLCPTGGITVESIAAYRKAGAEAFGIGGQLFQKPRVEAGDWEWIEREARRHVEAWRAGPQSL